jgi:hypothetical protein
MAENTIPDYPRGITFEQVWTALMENRKQMEETDRRMKETDRRMKETDRLMQETDRRMKETARQIEETDRQMKETDRQVKKTTRQMGDLHNRFGEIAEHLVAPGIRKRFNELGYHFGSMAPGGYRIFDKDGKIKTEVDILLENDEAIIAVEVKVKPAAKDVEHHIVRLKILREYRNRRNDERKIMGAIAGAIFGSEEKKATLEAGLYVIEQSGDTMKIDIPDGFVPGKW